MAKKPRKPALDLAVYLAVRLVVCLIQALPPAVSFKLGANGFRTYAIARTLDNPHLERFLKRFRTATGQEIIGKTDDFDRLTAALSAGGKVATLADQDAGSRGVFVDFFGRPASAHK